MKEEGLNALLQTRASKKEVARIKMQVEIKKKRLAELGSALEKNQQSVELSVCYLLLKRETERLIRVSKILEREGNKEQENAWVVKGVHSRESEYMHKFKEITNRYYSRFSMLNFTHREVPVEYYIHALATEECGVIEMGDSLIETKKGSLYYVRKKEILHLLGSGAMKAVKTDSKQRTDL
ncbi:uncharacterized protein NEMAJ01_0168 [Nematocida major]|uniref:uncharacterized protein n=1 Tax=Nematocida major TaxID=1912982 RepID=UPI002008B8E2|nr:uncharacterized protein NEMAJ01_0168 [Nematocida major]KAH9385272.1 hypothetical protein NEMAJ01_0168 [Nematocida major]